MTAGFQTNPCEVEADVTSTDEPRGGPSEEEEVFLPEKIDSIADPSGSLRTKTRDTVERRLHSLPITTTADCRPRSADTEMDTETHSRNKNAGSSTDFVANTDAASGGRSVNGILQRVSGKSDVS